MALKQQILSLSLSLACVLHLKFIHVAELESSGSRRNITPKNAALSCLKYHPCLCAAPVVHSLCRIISVQLLASETDVKVIKRQSVLLSPNLSVTMMMMWSSMSRMSG